MALFILVKRKGSKRFLGAIPAKKGATVKKLKKLISQQIKKGFSARIVTTTQLKRVISQQAPKLKRIKRKKRKKVKR